MKNANDLIASKHTAKEIASAIEHGCYQYGSCHDVNCYCESSEFNQVRCAEIIAEYTAKLTNRLEALERVAVAARAFVNAEQYFSHIRNPEFELFKAALKSLDDAS